MNEKIMARPAVDTLQAADIWFPSLAHPIKARLEMIRNHYLTQINKMIAEQKRFKDTDFTVSLSNDKAQYTLAVSYCFEPEYEFVATMFLAGAIVPTDVEVSIVFCPGGMFRRERVDKVQTAQLEQHIKNWLSRLSNELASIPVQRQIEEQQAEIQNILGQLDDISRDYLTREEAEKIGKKLDEMEARLTNNLQETLTNQTELEGKVKAISNDMSLLKENMTILNKRGWAKSFVARTFEWAKDPANRKMLTAGAQVAKEMLLEAGQPPQPPVS